MKSAPVSRMLRTLLWSVYVLSTMCSAVAQLPRLKFSVLTSGLQDPWAIAFTPAGDLVYTEKCRGISILKRHPTDPTCFVSDPILLFGVAGSGAGVIANDAFCDGQSGFVGLDVDPYFAEGDTYLYVMFPSKRGGTNNNRVARLRLNGASTAVLARVDIVTDIPLKPDDTANGPSGSHSGGRVRFGPDGWLYITTGDNQKGPLPQDRGVLGGKVLRVNRAGVGPKANRAPPGADPRIYAYGFRNVQGIAFRPSSGQPFIAEHGPRYSDEITPLRVGGNGGWDPNNRPSLTCPDGYCGYAGTITSMPMTDFNRFPNALRPAWVWNGLNRGLGPIEFIQGRQWGPWRGRAVVGMMRDESMIMLTLGPGGFVTAWTRLRQLPKERYRAIRMGNGGQIVAAVDSGSILGIMPDIS